MVFFWDTLQEACRSLWKSKAVMISVPAVTGKQLENRGQD